MGRPGAFLNGIEVHHHFLASFVYEYVAVQVIEPIFLQDDVGSEHTPSILKTRNPLPIDFPQAFLRLDHADCHSWMGIGNHDVRLELPAVGRHMVHQSVNGMDRCHFRPRQYLSARRDKLVRQSRSDETSSTRQPPRTLYEGIADLRKNIQRQLRSHLQSQRRSAKDSSQQRILETGVKVFRSAPLEKRVDGTGNECTEYTFADTFEEGNVFSQRLPLGWEKFSKPVHETVVSGSHGEAFPVNHYLVGTIRIELPPRKASQAEILEKGMKRLAFTEPAGIMETGIKRQASPAE